jgi:predicted O-linked N-acetylglucosamine transferase (SPINDLY family)
MNSQTGSLLQDAIYNVKINNLVNAKVLLLKILDIEPDNFDALNIIGVINGKENKHAEAIIFFKKAQKIRPDNNLVNFNLGKALSESGNDLDAIEYYKIAIRLDKNHLGSWLNFGKSLHQLERYDEALSYYDQAIKLKPDYLESHYNKANTLKILKRYDEAIIHYSQAIKLKPDYFNAYLDRGVLFELLKLYDEALFDFDQAIKLKPDSALPYNNKGNVLRSQLHYDQAIFNYYKAIKLKPDYPYIFGMILHMKMFLCNWQNFKVEVENLLLQIYENKKSSYCFPILSLIDSPLIHRKSSEIWINNNCSFNFSLGSILKTKRQDKIRIGYYSEDFREHPVANLIIELFELHNKDQFELFGFYFGPSDSSKMHKRVSSAFNQFIDVGLKSDKDIALMSREIGIDIAVDLGGFTGLSRPGIFSYRAAPIQVNYLGYPGTMGAKYIDYIIADPTLIPIES